MCGSGMFQCSTQEKVPDTQPCYSGSERTERPVRVSMYRHLLFQQVLYKAPIARWRGGANLGENRSGCGLELPPIFFSLDDFLVGQSFNNRLLPRKSVTVVITYSYGPSASIECFWLDPSALSLL